MVLGVVEYSYIILYRDVGFGARNSFSGWGTLTIQQFTALGRAVQ